MYKRLSELYNSKDIKDERRYDLEHFFECKTGEIYNNIIEAAKSVNAKRVFDIGCAYGTQSECFLSSGLEYIGIDRYMLDFWNKERYKYIIGTYPFNLNTTKDDIAVSVLCLAWNCYLYEKEKTLHEQLEQLSEDFDKVILYISKDKINYVKHYFPFCKGIDNGLYLFSKLDLGEKTYDR